MYGEDPQGRIVPVKVDMDGLVLVALDNDTQNKNN